MAARQVDVPALVRGVLAGDRRAVARAITLVESHRTDHRERAQELLVELLPHAGAAAIFPPGTVIAEAALELLGALTAQLSHPA